MHTKIKQPQKRKKTASSIYHNGGSGSMLAAVYSNESSLPKYLLGVSQQTTVNSEEGWQTIPLKDKISVKSGETVWLAVLFQNSTNIRSESGTPGRADSAQTWASGMPSEFGSSTTASTNYSIYADYIPIEILGNTSIYTSTDTSANRTAVPYTMDKSGFINSISIYHNGGSGNVILAIYSDNEGVPYYRMAMTASTPVNSSAGWQTIELTDSNSLYEEGETVWLAWVFENNPGLRYTSGTPGKAVSSQYWAGQMPSEFGSSSSSSYKYSICANYVAKYQQQEIELTGNPYMFTARAYDIETGLYYYRARYYNPFIGRFLQIDPAYSSMNLYAYCGNNPINCTDPMGLYAVSIDIPLGIIWDISGVADGTSVYNATDPTFMSAVQDYLDATVFGKCRGSSSVSLIDVKYTGSSNSGTYHCTFDTPWETNPFTIGNINGYSILQFMGVSLYDGRLADKIYGTSFCTIDLVNGTGTNLKYSDWFAAKSAAAKPPNSSIGTLFAGAVCGLDSFFNDPTPISSFNYYSAISSIALHDGNPNAGLTMGEFNTQAFLLASGIVMQGISGAGMNMAKSSSGPQYRWFRSHILSLGTTKQGGNVVTIGGKITYVGNHAPLPGEILHHRQIMWGTKSIFKW